MPEPEQQRAAESKEPEQAPAAPKRTRPSKSAKAKAVPTGPRCKKCGEALGEDTMKRHKKVCSHRDWQCPECNQRMPFYMSEKHPESCGSKLLTCEACGLEVAKSNWNIHINSECDQQHVKCELCDWEGLRVEYFEHEDECPNKEVVCDICMEPMRQYEMLDHSCEFFPSDECIGCATPLSDPEKIPAILMKEREVDENDDSIARHVRSCSHLCFCSDCAILWQANRPKLVKQHGKQNEDDGAATCPLCNERFDQVTALAEWTRPFYFAMSEGPAVDMPSLADSTVITAESESADTLRESGRAAEAWIENHFLGTGREVLDSLKQNAGASEELYYTSCIDFRHSTEASAAQQAGAGAKAPPPPPKSKPQDTAVPVKSPPAARPPPPPPKAPPGYAAATHAPAPCPAKSTAPPGYAAATPVPAPCPAKSTPCTGTSSSSSSQPASQRQVASNATVGPRKLRRPPPKKGDTFKGSEHWISPLDIHFTQDSVSHKFGDWTDEETRVRIRDKTLLDTVRECLENRRAPKRVEAVEVVWHKGQIYLAGSFNRRLCCWRLLTLYTSCFSQIKVRFRGEEEKDRGFNWKDRFTTDCNGHWVRVRHPQGDLYVGKRIQTDPAWWHNDWNADPGVQWPEAQRLLQRHKL
eukprot:TRINITY_DN11407_c0_g1_i1.p1 TRINITY_DN11407_c0_g1~~TRINITY_DN11407_c0_g1_i1.p1  ORF type:complete len:640 (-),score=119.93 TRINITY_DN11407_c0_g1_i1:13-1932(-)